MNTPTIEKEIKKQGNLIAGSGAFLGIGIAALSAVSLSPVATIMLCGAMLPLALDVMGLKLLIEKPKSIYHDIWLLDRPFRKRVSSWITNYLNNSESLTEKKYKVACLSLWMRHEGVDVNKVVNTEILRNLSEELAEKKEIEKFFPLFYLFGDHKKSVKDIFGIEPSVQTFLSEDKNQPDKLEIAKKVYKEYSQLGMAAKAFLHRNDFEELLVLQDYRFNTEDYNSIGTYLENVKQLIAQHNVSFDTTKLYSESTKETLNRLIENEENISHLKILSSYCSEILNKSSLEHLATVVQKKIAYLELNGKLPENTTDKPVSKKIKI